MNFLQIIKILSAIATIGVGLVSLVKPLAIRGFTGLEVSGGRGITEIRSILGALFIGFGGAVLFLNSQDAYATLGITYLTIGVVRTVSMFLDKSVVFSNIISVITEILMGVILVL
jgi:hypothetical protein